MPAITIRNLPEEVHRALKVQAAQHGRSTAAEIRDILETAVLPPQRVKLGSLLAELGRKVGGGDIQIERDKTANEPMRFE